MCAIIIRGLDRACSEMTDVADTRVETQTPPAPGATPGEPRACLHYLPLIAVPVARGARRLGFGTADRVPGPRTALRGLGGLRRRRGPARGTRTGEALGCATVPLAACMHTARASHVRSYVRRSTPRSIDRSIDKKKPSPAANQPPQPQPQTARKQKEKALPSPTVRFVCSYWRLYAWSGSLPHHYLCP